MTKTNPNIDAMFQAGAHLGYSRSRRHPSVKPYIFGTKNKVEIVNLEDTEKLLEKAKAFVAEMASQGKQILFVGTKAEAKQILEREAKAAGVPYVSERWIGGMLTNFGEIKKRVARLEDLTTKKEKGELAIYTKMERLLIDREIEKLQKNFGGIVSMKEKPKAMFIVDPRKEHIALEEALKEKIPVLALASTDCDIRNVKYPIVANDSAQKSISFFVGEIAGAYKTNYKPPVQPVEKKKEA